MEYILKVGKSNWFNINSDVTVLNTSLRLLISSRIFLVSQVYLDISFRVDPEVVIPLFIAPPSLTYPCEEVGPYPSGAPGVPGYSDFPAPLYPNPVPTGSGVFNNPATQQVNQASGSSEWPQSAPPYEFLAPAYTSPSVQQPAVRHDHQPEEQPPSYTSLF